ncbi:uncharacterized protein LOC128879232 [Hylaeus volcanicus]|uniref:uncharacterized protein LOC128879232 n=1 Tax=Hylaeus volcanicus TaxID=313075 RepID=UPI0023B84F7C|nr:uncharacterized protein LOC128879232 [Hylaeus volcanicus]XP_053984167.1 uncharacterized protein LOC128879232 [Hylaeus volcanicus]
MATVEVTTLFFLSMLLTTKATNLNSDVNSKASRTHSKTFNHSPKGGLISFNSEQEKLRIDWAVTIPFISIPLNHRIGDHGEVLPLLDVNTKALGFVGLLTTIFSIAVPLFSKNHHPQLNYRSEDNQQWSQIKNSLNEMVFGNNYVAPCLQRVVCSIVSVAAHRESPTSMDKIIDGLSSHEWFKDVTNGTIIQNAVNVGRKGNRDCAHVYKDCLITPKLLKTMMSELGIV